MTEYQNILTDLYGRLAKHAEERDDIDESTELAGHLNLDSHQIMELVLEVEDHFDISIPVNVLPDVKTVKDFAMQIEILTRGEE
jgi:acyl carrier protein